MNRPCAFAASLVFVLAVGAAAPAQCIGGDDGFDIGCCQPVGAATIPNFPAMTMMASWAELSKCVPLNLNTVTVSLSPPTLILCDYALINVFVSFPGGETISGMLAAKYARTFDLPAPGGQVWRFLVNGDLNSVPIAASTPCTSPLPRCSFIPGQVVHFDGHVDYVCNPGTILPSTVSFSLSHHSGCLSHAPWSCMPLGGLVAHTESSYHLVGPAPFVFGAASPIPAGPLISDAARTSFLTFIPSFAYGCVSEQKVGPTANLFGTPSGCFPALCPPQPGTSCNNFACTAATSCYEDVGLNFATCCVGAIWGPSMTVPIGGTPVAATGMLGIRLGSWGALPQYPSGVPLRVYFGVINYVQPQPCPPINSALNAAVGVSTSNLGLPFTLAPTCLPPAAASTTFLDLHNVLPLNTAPFLTPGYGCLAVSDVVWSFNTP
jgi:hypothetical protein